MINKIILASVCCLLASLTMFCGSLQTASDYFTKSIKQYKETMDERRQCD